LLVPSPNDNSRIASDADATRLLREAAKAPTLAEQQRLIGEAERVRTARLAEAERGRGLDLANAVVADTLTPVRVHEMHTTATDWIGELSTTASAADVDSEMVAQASLWYSKTSAIRPFLDEWEEQAKGMARRLAGAYGEKASRAENAFLTHAATVYNRELKAGLFALAADGDGDGDDTGAGQNDNDADDTVGHTAASGLPQVGDPGAPVVGGTVGPPATTGLDGELTSSERAPQLQLLEQNSGGSGGGGWPSPIVAPQHDVDEANGDSGISSDHAQNNTTFASRHHAEDVSGSPWAQSFGDRVFNGAPVGNHIPILNQTGEHKYMVRTHHTREDGRGRLSPMRRVYRSDLPDAHWDAESQAIADHADDYGVHPDQVVSSPAVREGESARNSLGGPADHYSSRKDSSMQTAACPSCRGRGRVAVRVTGASGLPQVEEVVDPNNNPHPENPALTPGSPLELVAFPWEMDPNQKSQNIQQAEQQIAQRQQMVGSRQARAEQVARQAYLRYMVAGQDDTGWLGDMGAGGNTPGEQDGGNPGPWTNLGQPDPVYGEGGDNGNQPLKPYGADEANDITNNPGTWQPGMDTHMDQGGRGQSTARREDPEIAKALAFVRQRRAYLEGR
jgi:hypothetical protein